VEFVTICLWAVLISLYIPQAQRPYYSTLELPWKKETGCYSGPVHLFGHILPRESFHFCLGCLKIGRVFQLASGPSYPPSHISSATWGIPPHIAHSQSAQWSEGAPPKPFLLGVSVNTTKSNPVKPQLNITSAIPKTFLPMLTDTGQEGKYEGRK
jgi:hypothetical protein